MHVIQLGPIPPPEGGVSRNMLAIGRQLRDAGHRCTFVATTRGVALPDERDVRRPRSAAALLWLLATTKFDILHVHVGPITSRVLALCLACAMFSRKRSVLSVHAGEFTEGDAAKTAKSASLAGFVFRRFAKVIAVNEKIALLLRRFGVADERIHVIAPFSVSLPDDKVVVPQNLADFYERHTPLLLAVGGLLKDYDPLFQIACMTDILAESPDAGLMIVGDGAMRVEVERAVAESRHADKICIAGNVEHAVTLHLINKADIMLRTTLFDGDAISVHESLFLGTPVIATDNGMRPDGISLIAIGDKAALVREITNIARQPKLSRVERSTDAKEIVRVIALYAELLGQKSLREQ